MADIIVDTYKLNQYAQRLSAVNSRIGKLDLRLDSLYKKVGLIGLFELIQADAMICYSWRLVRCQSYLQQTAMDFESTERRLLNADPANFKDVIIADIHAITSGAGGTMVDVIKEEISGIPEDLQSAGEALSWFEKQCEELPDWFTLGVEVLVPETIKDAYTITSGIFQGDLTLEETWDVAKNILSEKNTKIAVICETIDYVFETGVKRSDELHKAALEQVREGDILGAIIEGAEGFVDGIIGGSIDVIGDVGGGWIDSKIEDMPVVKGINKLTEYGTGLLGWNDGDGYSIGGLVAETTEKVSEGIDVVTDVITDTTDAITSAVTDKVKGGINFVKSWFD